MFNPGIVNIHIKHPPEASVQVHQVSQLDNYSNNGHQQQGSHSGSSSSSSYSYRHSESSQKVQQHVYNMVHPNQHGYKVPHYQPVASKNTLGRCFQETAAGQVGRQRSVLRVTVVSHNRQLFTLCLCMYPHRKKLSHVGVLLCFDCFQITLISEK